MDSQSITPDSPIPKSNNCKAYWSEPQAQLRSLRTEKARRRLHEFVCQAWPVLEPETPFVEGIHVGATGWIAGLVNAFPRESVALFAAAMRGDRARIHSHRGRV